VILVTRPLSPNSKFLYSLISLIMWSNLVTIALSVVKKYAEMLSIGFKLEVLPKKSGFGVHGGWKYFGSPPITICNHISWDLIGGKFGEYRWKIAISRAFSYNTIQYNIQLVTRHAYDTKMLFVGAGMTCD